MMQASSQGNMFYRHTILLLLALSLAVTYNCEEYYIVPLDSERMCRNYQAQCLPISDLALIGQYLVYENLTLHFLPGNHTLTEAFRLQNIQNVHITSSGQNTILELTRNGSLQLSMISELTIEHVKFTGSNTPLDTGNALQGLIINSISTFILKDCYFNDFNLPHQDGITIINNTANVSMVENSFANNNTTVLYIEATEVHIENCNFSGNAHGAVRITSTIAQIIDTKFNSNSAVRGGAVTVSGSTTFRECTFTNNQAQYSGGAIYTKFGDINIYDSELRNNSCGENGGAIYAEAGNVHIQSSELKYNSVTMQAGGAIYASLADVFITTSELSHNQAGQTGGAIYSNRFLSITNSKLINNSVPTSLQPEISFSLNARGGAIYADGGTVTIAHSELTENSVYSYSNTGAVYISRGNINVINSMLTKNTGGIDIFRGTGNCSIRNSELSNHSGTAFSSYSISDVTIISNCSFSNNRGGAIRTIDTPMKISISNFENNNEAIYTVRTNVNIDNCVLRNNQRAIYLGSASANISNTEFLSNWAPTGAAISAIPGNLDISKSTFINNRASYIDGTTVAISRGTMIFRRMNIFQNNTGHIYTFNSRLEFRGPTLLDNNRGELGGAIRAEESQVLFNSDGVTITNNQATTGGGLYLAGCQLFVQNSLTISHNSAHNGGAIYVSFSRLELKTDTSNYKYRSTPTSLMIFNNSALQSGGGIYASASSIDITDFYLSLDTNTAKLNGGGVYLEQNTKVLLFKTEPNQNDVFSVLVTMFNNSAVQNGGGIFVADDTEGGSACRGTTINTQQPQCFIQTIRLYGNILFVSFEELHYYNTFLNDNTAVRGADIYGGLLDRCTVRPTADPPTYISNTVTGLNYIKDTVASDILSVTNNLLGPGINSIAFLKELSIASDPVQVRLCDSPERQVRKGDRFTISTIAVDQVGNPVNATIRSSVVTESGVGRLKEGQTEQKITDQCTMLEYNVFSQDSTARVELYADGPCLNLGPSNQSFNILFLPCTCPVGLQPTQSPIECMCECNTALQQHQINNCFHDNGTIQVETQIWVGVVNNTGVEFVVSECPFDYCIEEKPIEVSLSSSYEIDQQCAFNRSGILCGECEEGLSLVLATSKCEECSNIFLMLIIPFALAGILLVLLILVFNLTVATGSIHGLIFYANMLAANRSVLLPFQNFFTVFISWVNLDLGIETCFYDGMSSHAKVLLQLVFPAYLFLLIFLIIILSKYFYSFAKLLSNRNPVAALATLIILSYSKLLGFIVAALQYTVLNYSNGTSDTVWLYDSNVQYFALDHTPRFIAAAVILLSGGLFTVLLFFGQWIPHLSKWKFMGWTKNAKYNGFMDAYHAPFDPKHRYWLGLLLFALIAHNIISAIALNTFLPLLSAGSIAVGLAVYKSILYPVYNFSLNHIVETLFFLNLAILAYGSLYVRLVKGSQYVLANISLAIGFVIFAFILCYHCYKYIVKKTKVLKNQKIKLKKRYLQGHKQDNEREQEEIWEQNIGIDIVYTNETVVEVDPDCYITPPIVRSAVRPDQLREPMLDHLAPITTGDYKQALPMTQPAPANNLVTYAVIKVTK